MMSLSYQHADKERLNGQPVTKNKERLLLCDQFGEYNLRSYSGNRNSEGQSAKEDKNDDKESLTTT